MPGKGSGRVTPPEKFKKLYLWFLLSAVVALVLGIISMGLSFMVIGSQASQTFQDLAKYEQDMQRYQRETDQWQRDGRIGPQPAAPVLGAPRPVSSGGVAMTIVNVLLGMVRLAVTIIATVFYCIFLYKAWELIQDGRARTTPGQAVGFMFIPFFNFYWYFVAIKGLADDLNQYSRERNLSASPVSPGMLIAAFVLMVSCLCYPVGLIFYFIGLNQIKNACVDIAAAKLAA